MSFLDRVDGTGALHKKTAVDLGVIGLAGRAAGNAVDVRADFSALYRSLGFKKVVVETGDVRGRLEARICECRESIRLIRAALERLSHLEVEFWPTPALKEGAAVGVVEAARGPVVYWVRINGQGMIQRCKVTDASFRNWQGLSFSVLGDIVPDFPVCNKSFDLSYSGNDL